MSTRLISFVMFDCKLADNYISYRIRQSDVGNGIGKLLNENEPLETFRVFRFHQNLFFDFCKNSMLQLSNFYIKICLKLLNF